MKELFAKCLQEYEMKLKDNIIIETSVKCYTFKGGETERGTE